MARGPAVDVRAGELRLAHGERLRGDLKTAGVRASQEKSQGDAFFDDEEPKS